MQRLSHELLIRMSQRLTPEDCDELAIPSYTHANPALRWMAWRRVEVVTQRLLRLLATGSGTEKKEVMDFGCGTGILFHDAVPHTKRLFGVDLVLEPAKMLLRETGLEGITLLRPNEAQERIPSGSLDIVVAAEVLEHLDSLPATLEWFRRCLKPSGHLLVSLPTESGLYKLGRWVAGFSGDYHHHTAAEIHQQILAAGFQQQALQKIPWGWPLSIYWVLEYRRR